MTHATRISLLSTFMVFVLVGGQLAVLGTPAAALEPASVPGCAQDILLEAVAAADVETASGCAAYTRSSVDVCEDGSSTSRLADAAANEVFSLAATSPRNPLLLSCLDAWYAGILLDAVPGASGLSGVLSLHAVLPAAVDAPWLPPFEVYDARSNTIAMRSDSFAQVALLTPSGEVTLTTGIPGITGSGPIVDPVTGRAEGIPSDARGLRIWLTAEDLLQDDPIDATFAVVPASDAAASATSDMGAPSPDLAPAESLEPWTAPHPWRMSEDPERIELFTSYGGSGCRGMARAWQADYETRASKNADGAVAVHATLGNDFPVGRATWFGMTEELYPYGTWSYAKGPGFGLFGPECETAKRFTHTQVISRYAVTRMPMGSGGLLPSVETEGQPTTSSLHIPLKLFASIDRTMIVEFDGDGWDIEKLFCTSIFAKRILFKVAGAFWCMIKMYDELENLDEPRFNRVSDPDRAATGAHDMLIALVVPGVGGDASDLRFTRLPRDRYQGEVVWVDSPAMTAEVGETYDAYLLLLARSEAGMVTLPLGYDFEIGGGDGWWPDGQVDMVTLYGSPCWKTNVYYACG